MTSQIQNSISTSKKASFQIAKFTYHLHNTIPQVFPEVSSQTAPQKPKILRAKKSHRNMIYHYVTHSCEGVSSLDAQSILESAKKLYVTEECVRMSEKSFKNNKVYKVPYLPIYGNFNEILEFHLVQKGENKQSKLGRTTKSRVKQPEEEGNTIKPKNLPPSNNFQLYVIHHCNSSHKEGQNGMRWESFIEKYHFFEENNGEQVKHRINYISILYHQEQEGGLFGYFTSTHKLYQDYLSGYLFESQGQFQNLSKMQGYLLLSKDRVDKKLKQLNDPSFQQTHKRWAKLPSEYYKQFITLKKHTMSYYNSIYEQGRHGEHIINNLICRYMHAKQYNYKQTLESILQYLKWQKQLFDNYNLSMFVNYHKLDFFTYLGKDFQGRLVLLNKASNLYVDKIIDIEQYCIYYIYYLQIWLQKKWKGFVDQYTIIADVNGLGVDNFKLSITKRNLSDNLKYSPERQHKLIAVNIGSFARVVWGAIKPLLPKRTLSKFSITGTDKQQILDILTKQMDISVIPQYLGGKNKRSFNNDLEQQTQVLNGQFQDVN